MVKMRFIVPIAVLAAASAGYVASSHAAVASTSLQTEREPMPIGAFSVSLAVKDLAVSHEFYKKLGFEQAGGDAEQNWLVLRSGTTTIGLFQGMFEDNIMTFNPGWGPRAQPLEEFEDIRAIQNRLIEQGLELAVSADAEGIGPAHIVLQDPDGNQIMFDQHVPAPGH